MVMTAVRPHAQELAVPAPWELSLPAEAGAVEIQLQTEGTSPDTTLCRIIILQPPSASSSVFSLGASHEDEPTWEDAAWQ